MFTKAADGLTLPSVNYDCDSWILRMPYEWRATSRPESTQVTAWPHRSLPRRDFARFILVTWAMLMIPAIALVGTAALWGILPFLVLAIGLIWYFLERSYRDGDLIETLHLTHDEVTLTRSEPRKPTQTWSANPHWVEISLHRDKGPVENYITLRGNGRTVEFGAFLSAEERVALHGELRDAFAKANQPKSE